MPADDASLDEHSLRAAVHRLALCTALLPCLGAAGPVSQHIQLSWQAPASCASAEEFERAIAPSPASAPEVRVRIETSAEGMTGEVSLIRPGQEVTPRRVVGESCQEVVEALLFVTSLALAEPPPDPELPDTSVVLAPERAAALPLQPDLDEGWERATGRPRYALASTLGPALQVATGLSPIVGAALAAQLEFPHRVRPALRLEVSSGSTSQTARDAGWVRLLLTAAKLEVVPGRVTWSRVRFGWGVAFEAGSLLARGVDAILIPFEQRSLWLAFSENVRIETRIRRGWYSELTLSLLQPISPQYFAEPHGWRAVYALPALGFASSLAVGYRFLRPDAVD